MHRKCTKILIADDHPIVRNALKSLLVGHALHKVIEAECGVEVLNLLGTEPFDLLILDMSMPGQLSGPALIQTIVGKRESPPPILVFSMSDESTLVMSALQAGASGYITKDCDPAMIITAVEKVAAGERYISPHVAEKILFNEFREADPLPQELLSRREYEVEAVGRQICRPNSG